MRNEEEVFEIDILNIVKEIKRHIIVLISVTIICGCIGFFLSKYAIHPQYESTSVLFVLSKETTLTSLADLQIGSLLAVDYMDMISGTEVVEDVIRKCNLDMEDEAFAKKIKINNPNNSRLLKITVTDGDPEMAQRLAYEIALSASKYIAEVMEMIPPKIIEKGKVAKNPVSPRPVRNAAIGAVIGFMLVCACVAATTILDDTVKTDEDVEKYLEGVVLASIPVIKGSNDNDKNKEVEKISSKRVKK